MQSYSYNKHRTDAISCFARWRASAPAREGGGGGGLTPVQSRDEDDLVPFLQDIVELAFEFPVGRVDQDEDARATVSAGERGGGSVESKTRFAGTISPPVPTERTRARGREEKERTHTVSPCENNSGRSRSSSKNSLRYQIKNLTSVSSAPSSCAFSSEIGSGRAGEPDLEGL